MLPTPASVVRYQKDLVSGPGDTVTQSLIAPFPPWGAVVVTFMLAEPLSLADVSYCKVTPVVGDQLHGTPAQLLSNAQFGTTFAACAAGTTPNTAVAPIALATKNLRVFDSAVPNIACSFRSP